MSRIGLVVTLVLAPLAQAKRVIGYVPPSVLERFGRSLVFVGVMAAMVMLLLALSIRGATGQRASSAQYRSFALVALACVVIGAGCAASDTLNDESRNPAMSGSFALTPLLATAVLLLQRRTVGSWIMALLLTPPFCLSLVFCLSLIQQAGFNLAW